MIPSPYAQAGPPAYHWVQPPRRTEPVRYHRLALTYRATELAWWRPLVELVLATAIGYGLAMVWLIGCDALLFAANYPLPDSGDYIDLPEADPAQKAMSYGFIAAMLPAPFLAARITGRQPRALWSVALRFRWGIFARALGVVVAFEVVAAGIDRFAGGEFAQPLGGEFADQLLATVSIVLLLLPMQCAAEEVLYRGTYAQVFGTGFRWPWLAYLPGVPIFLIGHDYGRDGLISVGVFAIMCAVLVHVTGGLEAAIAFHIGNNLSVEYLELTGLWDIEFADRPTLLLFSEAANLVLFSILFFIIRAHVRSRASEGSHRPPRHSRPTNQPWPYGYPPAAIPGGFTAGEIAPPPHTGIPHHGPALGGTEPGTPHRW